MMKYCRILKKLSFSQSGFTLIELIVGIFLSAVIFGGITATLLQIFHITESNNAHLLAVAQVQNAVYSINQDIQSAQSVSANGNYSFPLTLTLKSWDADKTIPQLTCTIVYSIDQQGNLTRAYSDTGGNSNTKIVARYISLSSADSNCSYNSSSHILTVQLTVIVNINNSNKKVEETRKVQIIPRPDLIAG